MSELVDKLTAALNERFPRAQLTPHIHDYGCSLVYIMREASDVRHAFGTPPYQDYRQHELKWLLHRFADLIQPYYDAAERRGTLLPAPPES